MKDIQHKVDSYIVANCFFEADNSDKKKLVETGIKRYMIDKICGTNKGRNILCNAQQEMSLHELAEILG